MIYWSERKSKRKLIQKQFYWGVLPTGKLELLVALINNPKRSALRRICTIVGLKIDDLPASYLRNSDFLKSHIFGELKKSEKRKRKNDKRYLRGELRRTLQQAHVIDYKSLFWDRASRLFVTFNKMEKLEQPSKNWNDFDMKMFELHGYKRLKEIIERVEKWSITSK